MGRIKNYFYRFFLVFVISGMVVLGGCASQDQDKTESPKEKEVTKVTSDKEKKKKKEQEIPKELFPGTDGVKNQKESYEDPSEEKQAQVTLEENPSAQTDKNTDEGETNTQTETKSNEDTSQIQVAVLVDSSVVENIVSFSEHLTLEEGATAYDALSVLVGDQVTGDGSYVTGIAGLSEKDYGSKSGWMYEVNGKMPNKSSNKYVLKNGDKLVWKYVK